jgi:hypothetical protein
VPTIELYATGDEIGFYSSVTTSGKGNGLKLTLNDVQTLGSSTDVFRIVVSNVPVNGTAFGSGQTVSVYGYPSGTLVYSNIATNPNAFDGRATSANHVVLDGPGTTGLVIDANGLTNGSVEYGPGVEPTRFEPFPFSNLSTTPPTFPCFVRGTLIETATGPLPVETLKVGDLVRTADHGLQPIRWIGKRRVAGHGAMAPVLIAAGALGNHRDLRVSPQHRMLLSHWTNEVHFGSAQVLVAARHLVNDTTIRAAPCAAVTYVHMVFDAHEIVFAEGIPTESLHVGAVALSALDRQARSEVLALFPDLESPALQTARRCLKGWEGTLVDAQPSSSGVRSPAAYRRRTAG